MTELCLAFMFWCFMGQHADVAKAKMDVSKHLLTIQRTLASEMLRDGMYDKKVAVKVINELLSRKYFDEHNKWKIEMFRDTL